MQSVNIQAATLFHMQFHETIHLLSVASDEMSARGWSLLHEVVSPRTIIIGWLYTTLYKSTFHKGGLNMKLIAVC